MNEMLGCFCFFFNFVTVFFLIAINSVFVQYKKKLKSLRN